jgi:tetratricopeptide (TPR) repeat protein
MNVSALEEYLSRNPGSPRFARLAADYFAAGQIGEAVTICTSGLAAFPRYATAHLILARCYAAEANFALALSSLEEVRKFLPLFPLYDQLVLEWSMSITPQAASEEPAVAEKPPSAPAATHAITAPALPSIPTPDPHTAPVRPTTTAAAPLPIVAASPTPAATADPGEVISAEELAQIESHRGDEDDRNRIVSKTLAEIYADQEEFEEAIVTYALLVKQKPEFKGEYEKRIAELKISLQKKLQQQNQK